MKHRNTTGKTSERCISEPWDNFKQPNAYNLSPRSKERRKKYLIKNNQKSPRFDENFKPTDPINSVNPKREYQGTL